MFAQKLILYQLTGLLSCSQIPNTNLTADHLYCIGRGIDFYSSKFNDSFKVLGNLNMNISNTFLNNIHHTN